MKKNLNRLNMFFVLLLMVIYSFVTYLFIDSDISFIHFVIISATFAIIVLSYVTGVLVGIVVSAISVFGLGAYIFRMDYLDKAENGGYMFFWILIFPVSALVAGYFGQGIAKISEKVDVLESELVKLITKDELTGFDNLREFYTELDEKISFAKRHNAELCLVMIQIGAYDDMNAVYGKEKTGEYIKLFAQIVGSTARLEDKKYRLYEDVFAVVAQDTGTEGAKRLEERMLETFISLDLHDAMKDRVISYGLKTAVVSYSDDIRSSLDFRDKAMEALNKHQKKD